MSRNRIRRKVGNDPDRTLDLLAQSVIAPGVHTGSTIDVPSNCLRFTRAERSEGTAAGRVSARSRVGCKRVLGGPSIFEINLRPLGQLALHKMASDVCEHFSLVWGR